VAQPVPASSFTSTSYQSIAKSGRHDSGMIQIVRQRTEWDI
jgi:hypothetical protein